ncbi:hypothetical protein DY000_02007367 [Brassica cretica]|uniref:Uncharacterized protein n=1 Tax=Brassica cretica TaxID=69181 RepID=A0ABQ7BZX7_BRACR|nr:hypothetical protein DY000_02007367 [Brassica cretica]
MAVQVLGEFHGFSVGVHEILYSYYFAPLFEQPVCIREDSRAVWLSFILEYRCVEAYDGISPAIPMAEFPVNVVRLSVSAIYDEHQKAKTPKRCPFYTLPPRLVRTASSVNGAGYGGPSEFIDSAGEGVGQMGAHEGTAREAGRALES